MPAIKTSQGEFVDSVRVRVGFDDKYLQEVATGYQRHSGSIRHSIKLLKMLKMTPQELESCKLVNKDGALYHYDSNNADNPTKIASTIGLASKERKNCQAFVMAKDGSFYIGNHTKPNPNTPTLSHASFLGGRPVELAGLVSINDQGKIDLISDDSGHYAPDELDMYRGIKALQKKMPGIFTANCKVEINDKQQDISKFLSKMEAIDPLTKKTYHQHLREAKLKKREEQRVSLLPLKDKINIIISPKGAAIDNKKLEGLFMQCLDDNTKAGALSTMDIFINRLKETNRLKDFSTSKMGMGDRSPLYYVLTKAENENDFKLAQTFIANGADIKSKDVDGNGIIHSLIPTRKKTIEFLINNGADINAVNAQGKTALKYAVSEYYEYEGIKEASALQSEFKEYMSNLIGLGADTRGLEGIPIIKDIIDSKASSQKSKNPLSPLEIKIDSLIKQGSEPIANKKLEGLFMQCMHNKKGDTSLNSMDFFISKLKETGRLKDFINHDLENAGMLPLYYAATENNINVIQTLLDNGADIKRKDADGYSILHNAHANKETIKLLINNGADINAVNAQGKTVIQFMIDEYKLSDKNNNSQVEKEEIIAVLIKAGANIEGLEKELVIQKITEQQAKEHKLKLQGYKVESLIKDVVSSDITPDRTPLRCSQKPTVQLEH